MSEQTSTSDPKPNIALAFVLQAAVVAAILLYIGYVYTDSTYGYFGLYVGTLGLPVADVALRSVNGIANPSLAIVVVALVGTTVELLVIRKFSGDVQRSIAMGTISAGLLLAIPGLLLLVSQPAGWSSVAGGIMCCTGFAAAAAKVPAIGNSADNKGITRTVASLSLTLAVLALFIAISGYAKITGEARGEYIAQDLARLPAVTIFARHSLDLAGPGITVTAPQATDGMFEYAGLKLLLRSGEQSFLLPAQWKHEGSSNVIILKDSDEFRIEVQAAQHV